MHHPRRGFSVRIFHELARTSWWALSPAVHAALLLVFLVVPVAPGGPSDGGGTFRGGFGPSRLALEREFLKEEPIGEEIEPEVVEEGVVCEVDNIGGPEEPIFGGSPLGVGPGPDDLPFDGPSTYALISVGGGAGGAFGGRGGHRNIRACGSAAELLVIEATDNESTKPPVYRGRPVTEGTLYAQTAKGKDLGTCLLEKTDVRAKITAFLAEVDLKQHFANPFRKKIHAVYVFPLPRNAAVCDFLLTVGDRTIRGVVREREEARRIYEAAVRRGQTASLVSQERPNIFVQRVANLEPDRPVDVSVTYIHPLRIRNGTFEFVFPMVVGPRYKSGSGSTPVVSPPEPHYARPGTNISVEVELDAGVGIESLASPTHRIEVEERGDRRALVRLLRQHVIPNRDFVLRYGLMGDSAKFGVLAHRSRRGGYFALLATPKTEVSVEETAPREMVFVLDASGSMSGAPIVKSKAVVRRFLTSLNRRDTFRLMRFANRASALANTPLPATVENVERALDWLDELHAGGGTEMLAGIKAALEPPVDPGRLRIVCFLTDGYIGSERVVLAAVERLRQNARLFSFGVGSSVNRFLLDKLAQAGRGAAQYVLTKTTAEAAAERFHRRLRAPFLTDLTIDFGGLPVTDVFPERIPDLFEGLPVLVVGRYRGGGESTITLRGRRGGRPFVEEIPVTLPDWEEQNALLSKVWARCRIEEIMDGMWRGLMPRGRERVTRLGLSHGLVTAFTSFVAVDDSREVPGDAPTITVAVPLPEGVRYSGVFGPGREYCEIRPFGLRLELTGNRVIVAAVSSQSPAATAGIEPGDEVLAVNGTPVSNGREAEAATGNRTDGLVLDVRRRDTLLKIAFCE
jgi:Ca-activated chloride channel family protein